jgi:hypothetical protein
VQTDLARPGRLPAKIGRATFRWPSRHRQGRKRRPREDVPIFPDANETLHPVFDLAARIGFAVFS